jgi:hypothetical protein
VLTIFAVSSVLAPESKALGEQRAKSQKALLDFLQTDLDIAFTMLRMVELTSNPEHYHSALGEIRQTVHAIRNLQGRIENPELWKTIHNRANELERTLESLAKGMNSNRPHTVQASSKRALAFFC